MNVTKPTLVVNLNTCEKNIQQMANKAQLSSVVFRPHFKTHQSAVIANLFKKAGVSKITVSSIDMALQFAAQGWNDITIAFPVNILQINDLNKLASEITLNLVIENHDALLFLNRHLKHKTNILLKIDAGYGRTGINYNNHQLINLLTRAINSSSNLHFIGFLSHFGNSYSASSRNEIKEIYTASLNSLTVLKQQYPNAFYSIGDTPSCSIINKFTGVSEIRPGNFVYYDSFQMNLGSCSIENISASMACPVVAIHENRNEIIIHGGAVHFSKESINIEKLGTIYGLVVNSNLNKTNNAFLKKISQEHGTIVGPKEWIKSIKIGDIVHIIPIHSCLTANLMKENTIYV